MSPITPPPATAAEATLAHVAQLRPTTHIQPAFAELTAPSVLARSGQAPYGWSIYVVKRGDTLSDIAKRYRTTVRSIVSKNRLTSRHSLDVGQRIAVPRTSPKRTARIAAIRHAADSTYVVRPGDTISHIASRHKISQASLLRANRLSGHAVIRPGQRLVVPGGADRARRAAKASRARAARTGVMVTVASGQTVSHLAVKYGVTQASILRANGLRAGAKIRVGQKLRIPGAATPTRKASAHPRLSSAGRANLRYLNAHPAPARSTVKRMILRAARQHGVDPKLALAIGWQESRWNQRAVSEDNAIGVMQCLPSTGQWMSGVLGRRINLLKAADNIQCGVGLLRTLGRSVSSEREVIAAYYQGLGALQDKGMYGETKEYVASVLRHKSRM